MAGILSASIHGRVGRGCSAQPISPCASIGSDLKKGPIIPRDARQLLAAFQQAMLDFSPDDLADLFAVDAIYEFPFLAPQRGSDRYDGREEIRADFRRVWGSLPGPPVKGFSDLRVHDSTEPGTLTAEFEFDAVDPASGRAFSSRSVLILRAEEGEIAHLRDYSDILRVSQGLGRLPELFDAVREEPPAYLLSEVTPRDPEAFAEYRDTAARSIADHGGRYLVRGGPVEALEGSWPDGSTVVLCEFPSRAHLDGWYSSDDYAPALRIRDEALYRRLVVLEPAPDRPVLRRVRAARAHRVPDRDPIRVRPGDEVIAGERSDEWPEFVFVEAAGGNGWVPARHLAVAVGPTTVEIAYDTTELATEFGQTLAVIEEDPRSGWTWCRAEDGGEGWVPDATLEVASD